MNQRWLFTLFDYENPDLPNLFIKENHNVRYAIWQLEKCPETGREHFQGYVVFRRTQRLAACRKFFDGKGHWEAARGSDAQCIAYCSKKETKLDGPWEFGSQATNQGKRNEMEEVKVLIDGGSSEREIASEHFGCFVRYHRGFREYRRISSDERDFKTIVIVLWGGSGYGKSSLAKWIGSQFTDVFWRSPKSEWWDDYAGQAVAVFDEETGDLPFDVMLRLMDNTPCRVKTKGGFTNWRPKVILITSKCSWREWYNVSGNDHVAISRRIDYELFFVDERRRTLIKGDKEAWMWKQCEYLKGDIQVQDPSGGLILAPKEPAPPEEPPPVTPPLDFDKWLDVYDREHPADATWEDEEEVTDSPTRPRKKGKENVYSDEEFYFSDNCEREFDY